MDNEYYQLDSLSDPECTVKFKDNARTCGNCHHLIFKDYKHHEGFCDKLRTYRNLNSPCYHEEEMS